MPPPPAVKVEQIHACYNWVANAKCLCFQSSLMAYTCLVVKMTKAKRERERDREREKAIEKKRDRNINRDGYSFQTLHWWNLAPSLEVANVCRFWLMTGAVAVATGRSQSFWNLSSPASLAVFMEHASGSPGARLPTSTAHKRSQMKFAIPS